jgi:hypothetical protein
MDRTGNSGWTTESASCSHCDQSTRDHHRHHRQASNKTKHHTPSPTPHTPTPSTLDAVSTPGQELQKRHRVERTCLVGRYYRTQLTQMLHEKLPEQGQGVMPERRLLKVRVDAARETHPRPITRASRAPTRRCPWDEVPAAVAHPRPTLVGSILGRGQTPAGGGSKHGRYFQGSSASVVFNAGRDPCAVVPLLQSQHSRSRCTSALHPATFWRADERRGNV